ncbi:MAG: hypothetical protein HY216_09240, partial [Candidatus Rokubacteria bacterium]|nr:hypothetical protein [Candidatus Rokubacteria bacterium]
MARALQLVLLVVVLAACQQAAAPPVRGAATAADPLADAREAMGRREWSVAAARLRAILVGDPRNVEAHYRLGVSASHLDLVDETRHEFEWVVANGVVGTPEVKSAREWLAGVAAAPTDVVVSQADAARGAISGHVVW